MTTLRQDPDTGVMVDPSQVGEGELSEEQMIYKENILDYYKHPRNKQRLLHADLHYKDTNPLCGDTIEVFVKLDNSVIVEIGYLGSGCAISQAAMSMLTEKIKGMNKHDVARLSRDDMLALLGIPIGPVRMKCAMLGLRTTQKAFEGIQ